MVGKSASGSKKEALVSNLKIFFSFFLCVRILYLNKKVPVAFGEKKKQTFSRLGIVEFKCYT